jgi:hypothetical protein
MTFRKLKLTVYLALCILFSFGCRDFGDTPTGSGGPGVGVSFSASIQDTLIARCALPVCHGQGSSQNGFTMGNVSWNEIRNGSGNHGPILVPGDASNSNLFMKTTLNPPFGARMPADGPPYLSLEAQAAIRDWINQGALDN